MNIDLGSGVEIIRRFKYRRSAPGFQFFTIEFSSCDEYSTLWEHLAELSGEGNSTNHEGYMLRTQGGGELFLFFSDWKLYVCCNYRETRVDEW